MNDFYGQAWLYDLVHQKPADDMADLLFAVNPTTEEETKLVNPDEKDAGKKVDTVNAPKAQTKTPGVTKNFDKKSSDKKSSGGKKAAKKK